MKFLITLMMLCALVFSNLGNACLIFYGWYDRHGILIVDLIDNDVTVCQLRLTNSYLSPTNWLKCVSNQKAWISDTLTQAMYWRGPGNQFQFPLEGFYGVDPSGINEVWKFYANNYGCKCDGYACTFLISLQNWLLFLLTLNVLQARENFLE